MRRWRRIQLETAVLCLIAALLCAPVARGELRTMPLPDFRTAGATIHIPTPEIDGFVYTTTAVPRVVWDRLHPALQAVVDDIEAGEVMWFVSETSRLGFYEAQFDVTSIEEVVTPGGPIGWVVTARWDPFMMAFAPPPDDPDDAHQSPDAGPEPTPVPTIAPTPTPAPMVPVPTPMPASTPEWAPVDPSGPAASVSMRLERGWNLFSFNVLPANGDVAAVLSSIAGKYSLIETSDGTVLSHRPDLPPEANTLKTLDPYHGYWIRMDQAVKLSIVGTPVPPTTPITLRPGTNLVSFLAGGPLPVKEALASIADRYSAVLGFEGRAVAFYPNLSPELNTLRFLSPGHGYMIVMNTGGTLVYPGNQ